jgi:O-antigen/teichoic acid export membrane protein
MSLHQTLFSNSVYRLLNIIAQFLITIILTRLMGVQGYGIFSLVIAVANIFNLFTSLGLDSGITFHTASDKVPFGGIVWLTAIIVTAQIVLWLLTDVIYQGISGEHVMGQLLNGWQVAAIIMLIVSISVTEKFTALFNGYHLYSLLNRFLLFTNLIILALFIFLWFNYENLSPETYILIFIISSVLQSLFLLIAFRVTTGWQFSFRRVPLNVLKNFFSFIMIVYVANLVQFLAYRADYWILEHYYPQQKELGWYALAVKLVQFFWIVPNLLASIIFPNVADQKKGVSKENISRLIRVMNAINLVLGLLCVVVVGWLIRIFFGSDYEPSIRLFLLLLPGALFFCITTVLAAYFSGINKPVNNLYASLICLVVVIVLDFLLIPELGKQGAAIASSIAYIVTTIFMLITFCIQESQPIVKLLLPGTRDIKSVYNTIQQLIGRNK